MFALDRGSTIKFGKLRGKTKQPKATKLSFVPWESNMDPSFRPLSAAQHCMANELQCPPFTVSVKPNDGLHLWPGLPKSTEEAISAAVNMVASVVLRKKAY